MELEIMHEQSQITNLIPTLSLLRSGTWGSILMLSCTCCCRSSAAGCCGPRRPVQTLTCLILNKSTLTNKRLRFVWIPTQTNLNIWTNLRVRFQQKQLCIVCPTHAAIYLPDCLTVWSNFQVKCLTFKKNQQTIKAKWKKSLAHNSQQEKSL